MFSNGFILKYKNNFNFSFPILCSFHEIDRDHFSTMPEQKASPEQTKNVCLAAKLTTMSCTAGSSCAPAQKCSGSSCGGFSKLGENSNGILFFSKYVLRDVVMLNHPEIIFSMCFELH